MSDKDFREKEFYKRKIIEMVKEVKNPEFLEFLYQLLQSFKKKWGI